MPGVGRSSCGRTFRAGTCPLLLPVAPFDSWCAGAEGELGEPGHQALGHLWRGQRCDGEVHQVPQPRLLCRPAALELAVQNMRRSDRHALTQPV